LHRRKSWTEIALSLFYLTDNKNHHMKLFTQSFTFLLISDFIVCTITSYLKTISKALGSSSGVERAE